MTITRHDIPEVVGSFLRGAPKRGLCPSDCAGWDVAGWFICGACAGRIVARGCALPEPATFIAVSVHRPYRPCIGCTTFDGAERAYVAGLMDRPMYEAFCYAWRVASGGRFSALGLYQANAYARAHGLAPLPDPTGDDEG